MSYEISYFGEIMITYDDKYKLTDDARNAINNHLLKWFTFLGFVNLATLVAAFGYIFFFLPEKAVNEAKIYIQNKASKEVEILQNRLFEVTGKAIETSGRAQERAEVAYSRIGDIEISINNINTELAAISKNDTMEIKRISETLNNNPETKAALVSVSMLHNLKQEQKIKNEVFEKFMLNVQNIQAEAICAAMNIDQGHWVKVKKRTINSNSSCNDICDEIRTGTEKYAKCFLSLSVPESYQENDIKESDLFAYVSDGCNLRDTDGPNYCCCNYMK